MRKSIPAAIVAVIAAVVLATQTNALDALTVPSPEPQVAAADVPVTAAPTPAEAAQARGTLIDVAAGNLADVEGYTRDEFGSGWTTTDGCDTRQRILARDLVDETVRPDGCRIATGTLVDPYTGTNIAFTADAPMAVQIDHVVPLSLAWGYGASKWSADKREAFANDPANLLAVDGSTNGSKSDSGAGEWTPPNRGGWCLYSVRYIGVLRSYDLPVSRGDRAALNTMLDTCPRG